MKILDIDLDFFQDSIANYIDLSSGIRLCSEDYNVNTKEEVRNFLSKNCGLSTASKLKGMYFVHHDEVFYDIRSKIEAGVLICPFDVIHIDAHADLGLGDTSYIYIMTELIHKEPAERLYPNAKQINSGNFLIYLILSKWIKNLLYVYHPELINFDYPHYLFRGNNGNSEIIEVKKYSKGTDIWNLNEKNCIGIDEPFLINSVQRDKYQDNGDFDFVYLTQSPEFTTKESDDLFSVFKEFIEFDNLD